MNSILQGKRVNRQAPQTDPLLAAFYNNLPAKPYCTDQLGHLNIRPKAIAARNAYIEPNPITRAYWLIFDMDTSDRRYWPDEPGIPCPNMQAENPDNSHMHLFYMIDPAVYTLRQARRKPLRLAADVDKGLTALLGADPAYGKLISKNPLSSRWFVWVWHYNAWGLTELLDYIPDNIKRWKPRPRDITGLGRNCTVFEEARSFAYSEWRRQGFQDYDRLFNSVQSFAANYNAGFNTPMLPAEVKGIARSISKWTARHMDAEGLRQWGEAGRKKSLIVRRTKAQARADEIRVFKAGHPDMSNRLIAKVFNCDEKSVRNAIKG
jgi:hypothetical protein